MRDLRLTRPSLLSAGLLALMLVAGCRGKQAEGAQESGEVEATPEGETTKASERPTSEELVERLHLETRSFPLLIWSVAMVEQDYFDARRFDPRGQLATAADQLGLHTPEFFAEIVGEQLKVTVRSRSQEFPLAEVHDLATAADLLERVLVFTAEVLSLEDEPLHELEYAAINGFLSPLDPHTILLTPEENAELGIKTRGHFGGIGAEIRGQERRIVVVRVLPDSPAQKAGLRDLDLLLEIDEQSTVNMTSSDAQALLRGPVDEPVVVKVRRGDEVLTLTITRGVIRIPAVRSVMLPGNVGYVQIASFQEDTTEKLHEALVEFQNQGKLAGVIFDLRDNSGGLLTQGTGVLDEVVTGGELVIVHSAHGREHQDGTPELAIPLEVPIVALVDEEAASAAEIVGGSLKHLDRAVILGRASFGKGTVQELHPATPYGRELALKLTIAEYRVAGDRKIQSIGVVPDLQLLPVQLSAYEGVAAMYDVERFERARECGRTLHLPSAVHEADARAEAALAQPKLSLRYFAQPPAGAELPTPIELGDPEIRLAREVAVKLEGKVGRRAQLDALPAVVGELAAVEDQRIRAGIEPWKIDWTPIDDPADAETKLELALSIGEPPAPGQIALPTTQAGKPFTLHVEVRNPSDRDLEQVHLITDCPRDELDGIEVLIGKLGAGQTLSRDLELQVMGWHVDFVDTLAIAAHVGEPEATPDGEAQLSFAVVGAPRPQFAFDYWIIDDPRLAARGPSRPKSEPFPGELPFTIEGNGDGLLQPGERVLLAFQAWDEGGDAPDARVLLRNLSGKQGLLEEGLFVHGPLGQGGSFMGAFGISIAGKADPALPLELELIVGDGLLHESVEDKLLFRLLPGRDAIEAIEGDRLRAVAGSEPLRVYAGADASMPVVAELEPGALVEVEGRAGEWLAIAGPKGQGRRLWIPADRVEAGARGSAKPIALPLHMVDPPKLEIQAVPEQVEGQRVTISGQASHATRVRDVVVIVQGSAPGQPQRKVFYLANPELEGPAARTLAFSTEVPLVAGSNRIVVITRDHDKVERRRELWVHAR
ncbi:MXAN_5808 family serine peptidase [Nannocystaceae bacterium ST9]